MSEKGPATGSALPQGCGFFQDLRNNSNISDISGGCVSPVFLCERSSYALSRNNRYRSSTR